MRGFCATGKYRSPNRNRGIERGPKHVALRNESVRRPYAIAMFCCMPIHSPSDTTSPILGVYADSIGTPDIAVQQDFIDMIALKPEVPNASSAIPRRYGEDLLRDVLPSDLPPVTWVDRRKVVAVPNLESGLIAENAFPTPAAICIQLLPRDTRKDRSAWQEADKDLIVTHAEPNHSPSVGGMAQRVFRRRRGGLLTTLPSSS